MKLFKGILLFCLLTLCFGCSENKHSDKTSIPAVAEHVKPRYAQGFDWKVLADSSYLITIFNLESPGDTLQVIRWKKRSIERLASLSTTHIPFFASLECMQLLKGVGFADRLPKGEAKRLFENNDLINLTSGNELEPEAVFSIEPDLLFVYPFGGKSYDKFLSKGIGCVQVSEYLEKHPLGRAEWIRLFGCLLNKQSLADSVFAQLEQEYVSLRDSIAKRVSNRPVVFAGSMDGDRWAVPSVNSYLATLIYDAGGSYLFRDSSATGNLVLPFESFYQSASKADYWGKIIYEPNPNSPDVITQGDNRLRDLKAFGNHQVFVCNAMQTDYHGQAVLEPHVLLNDISLILSGDTNSTTYRYFKPWVHY
jgi:iron complex transport system substrate-binding protein